MVLLIRMVVLLSELIKIITESEISKMVRSCIDFSDPLLRREPRPKVLKAEVADKVLIFLIQVSKFLRHRPIDVTVPPFNQKKLHVRMRLISFFYHNFGIFNSGMQIDIKNLFPIKRFRHCKNTIGFFCVVPL